MRARLRLLKGRILQCSRGEWEGGKVGCLEGTPAADDAAFQGSFHLSNTSACAVNSRLGKLPLTGNCCVVYS